MPSAASRPKQRQLIRWNDDLDKSLLLFITHTCAELGIKIPYDEVAKRMGSHFTEGAIQQHISKLRAKLSALQVVPVPNAPKRGQVTNRPSSIYTQKSRVGMLPAPPATSKARGRKTTTIQQMNGGQAITAADRPRPRRTTRQIKRSSSDPGDSDDEFAGANDTGLGQINGSRKRARRGRGRSQTINSGPPPVERRDSARTIEIMQALAEADERFDQQYNGSQDGQLSQDGLDLYNGNQTAVDPNQGNLFPGGHQQYYFGNHTGLNGAGTYDEEEEEEEEDLPGMARNAITQQSHSQFNGGSENFMPNFDDQVSPTSTTHMAHPTPLRSHSQTFPTFDGQGQGTFTFGNNTNNTNNPFSTISTSSTSAMPFPDFSGYNTSPFTTSPNMPPPPPAMPSAVMTASNIPPVADSIPWSRNPSMFSQASSSHTTSGGGTMANPNNSASVPSTPAPLQQQQRQIHFDGTTTTAGSMSMSMSTSMAQNPFNFANNTNITPSSFESQTLPSMMTMSGGDPFDFTRFNAGAGGGAGEFLYDADLPDFGGAFANTPAGNTAAGSGGFGGYASSSPIH